MGFNHGFDLLYRHYTYVCTFQGWEVPFLTQAADFRFHGCWGHSSSNLGLRFGCGLTFWYKILDKDFVKTGLGFPFFSRDKVKQGREALGRGGARSKLYCQDNRWEHSRREQGHQGGGVRWLACSGSRRPACTCVSGIGLGLITIYNHVFMCLLVCILFPSLDCKLFKFISDCSGSNKICWINKQAREVACLQLTDNRTNVIQCRPQKVHDKICIYENSWVSKYPLPQSKVDR